MEEAAGLIALTAASVEDDEIDDGVAGKLAASDDSAGGGSRGGGSDIAGGGSTAEVGGGNSNRKGDWWKSRRPSSSRKPTEPLSPPLASKNPPGSGKVDGIWEENGGGIAAADASISSSRFSTIIASPTSGGLKTPSNSNFDILGRSTTYGKVKCEYQGRSITGRRRRRVQRQAVRYGRDLEGVKELNHRLHDPNLHLHALDVFRGLPHQPFELQGFTICHQLLEQSKPPLEASRSSVFRAHVDNPLDRLCFHCRRARLIEATLPSGHLQLSAAMDQTILLLL
ncbi:hypothetical protein MUK42_25937 [Musa troglodytarum]|uniref:Uncharacterized protein n=1 Tax=Musa troglodytarum TaxID=320322 RepID=A0A9E7F2G3_9LILI|nr:hypothetical protein MUK42_25937 [Musa troglodytarum]